MCQSGNAWHRVSTGGTTTTLTTTTTIRTTVEVEVSTRGQVGAETIAQKEKCKTIRGLGRTEARGK
jgi:hypothetical protein